MWSSTLGPPVTVDAVTQHADRGRRRVCQTQLPPPSGEKQPTHVCVHMCVCACMCMHMCVCAHVCVLNTLRRSIVRKKTATAPEEGQAQWDRATSRGQVGGRAGLRGGAASSRPPSPPPTRLGWAAVLWEGPRSPWSRLGGPCCHHPALLLQPEGSRGWSMCKQVELCPMTL